MSQWLGYAVSVRCESPLGCYQGTVAAADGAALTLTKAFRNGFPYPKEHVTLNAADIKSLSIIEAAASPPREPAAAGGGRGGGEGRKHRQRATVCESLQASHRDGGSGGGMNRGAGGGDTRNKGGHHATSTGIPIPGGGGGGGRRRGAGGRDEAAFGAAVGAGLMEEFDFERNNALFDKHALWQTMGKPDLIPSHAYRHDQNVLGSAGEHSACIEVPLALRGRTDYVTDAGLRVPSACASLRRQLWDALTHHELQTASLALLARAACDVLVRLAGGNRRLEPRNRHQAPRAHVLATRACHHVSHAALITARLLSSHGMQVCVCLETNTCSDALAVPSDARAWHAELRALHAAGVPVHDECDKLGEGADVLLVGTHAAPGVEHSLPSAGAAWARSQRGAVVALEPPAHGWPGLVARATLQALLPACLSPSLGQLYLADVAPPPRLMASVGEGLVYHTPFGASSVLPLHAADSDRP